MKDRASKSRRINVTKLRQFLASDDAKNLSDEQRKFLLWRAQERNQRARYETWAWRNTGKIILRELAGSEPVPHARILKVRRLARRLLKTVIPARKVDMLQDLRLSISFANNEAAYKSQQLGNASKNQATRNAEICRLWKQLRDEGKTQQQAVNAINTRLKLSPKLGRTRILQLVQAPPPA